tara:strand:- start:1045 stop:2055 length:1011 start_codon:yes stop_codon:yes gene_type:complete
MAGIVKGMFGPTPEELQAENQQMRQEMLARFAQQGGSASLGGALGVGLGMGINKLFGLEDPRLTKSTTIAKTLQDIQQELGTDATDPIKLYSTVADKMNALGYSDEASIALQQLTAAKDKERSYALEERKVSAAEALSQVNLANKQDEVLTKKAEFLQTRQDKQVTALEKAYSDSESVQSKSTDVWASQFENSVPGAWDLDTKIVADTFKGIHLGLSRLTQVLPNGSIIPLYSPEQAAEKARTILATKKDDKPDELKYFDSPSLWNPFGSSVIKLPDEIMERAYAEAGAVAPDDNAEVRKAGVLHEKAPAITQEEYNALKPGMEYTAPDGSKRTKK